MTVNSFGKATVAIVILTAFAFLTAFMCGVPATPKLMAPWSVLAFSIIGTTLWMAPNPNVDRLSLHCLGAILVLAVGGIVSAEHLAHAGSTAFDRLLFPNLLPRNVLFPGRPAPLAGFRYCLLGLMLFLLRSRRRGLVLLREWT